MSGLFSWATDTLASVTSSVMAPFRGDVTPAPPEIHVSGKQTYRKQNVGGRAKKRAGAKRKAQIAAKKNNDGSKAVDSDGPEDYEPDEHTKMILAKMAEAAELRRQEEREAEEAEAELLRKREEDLAHSIVREMPADPMREERAAALQSLRDDLAKIGAGEEFKKFEDFQQALPAKQNEFDDLLSRIEQVNRAISKKTPRPPFDKAQMTPAELRDKIQNEELKPDCNELEVKNLYNALVALISQGNLKVFFNEMQNMINAVSSQRSKMLANFEKSRNEDVRQRAIERLAILYDSVGDSSGAQKSQLRKAAVVGKNLDLSVDFVRLAPHQRKIERKFMCIITPPRQRQQGRTLRVWGHEKELDRMIEWVKACDWSGNQTRSYDRRIAGLIVGRNGATIQQIENETDCLLNLDNSNQLTVYGKPESVQKVWELVDGLKAETRNQQVTRSIDLDPRIGRALLALHRSEVQAIEDQYQCRVTVWLQPEEGQPRIFIRCGSDKQDEVFAEVQKTLVDGYCVLEFEGSARAISRMLIPQRMPGRASQINNEFKSFQQDLGLFVQREGVRGAESDPVAAQTASLWIVCRKSDSAIVESTVDQLLKKADYSTERISIMREQQRIFTAENRGLIEASSGGCRVSIVSNPNEGTLLMLLGTEDSIEKGKQIVRDILEREGAVETVDLGGSSGSSAVVDYLLRDRAAVLRSMEDLHAVSIHVDREHNTARIIGDRTAIENAAREIAEIESEIARSHDDTIRLVVTIDADKVPMLIGRTGQTIQQIRNIPGVQSVEVPKQAATQDAAVVDVVLVGRTAALEEAQTFIENLVNRYTPSNDNAGGSVDYGNRIGRGRGRRGANRQRETDDGEPAAVKTSNTPLQFEESAFPALGDVVTVDDA